MIRLLILIFIIYLAALHTATVYAESIRNDTIVKRQDDVEKFSWRQTVVPVSLIAIGSLGLYYDKFRILNEEIKEEVAEARDGHYMRCDEWLQYIPAGGYMLIGLVPGIEHRSSFVERFLAASTAYAIMGFVVNTTKHTIKEKRPDSRFLNSFPSGHTANAFTGAELMHLEYGDAVGTTGYLIAIGVGCMRVYNERHWFNDVLAGAGIGILSARAAYWLLPFERKLLRLKSRKVDACIIPTYMPQVRGAGIACAISF